MLYNFKDESCKPRTKKAWKRFFNKFYKLDKTCFYTVDQTGFLGKCLTTSEYVRHLINTKRLIPVEVKHG
jgi:hypothetical protein